MLNPFTSITDFLIKNFINRIMNSKSKKLKTKTAKFWSKLTQNFNYPFSAWERGCSLCNIYQISN